MKLFLLHNFDLLSISKKKITTFNLKVQYKKILFRGFIFLEGGGEGGLIVTHDIYMKMLTFR